MTKSDGHSMPEMIYVDCSLFPQSTNSLNLKGKKQIKNFYISKYPISVSQFKKFVKASGFTTNAELAKYSRIWQFEKAKLSEPYSYDCYIPHTERNINWRHNEFGGLRKQGIKTFPVLYVSWFDAIAYCNYLNNITNNYYRLPTIAEWLYVASFNKSTTPVSHNHKLKLPPFSHYKTDNTLNIECMNSYVFEWCLDWKRKYSKSADYNTMCKVIVGSNFFNDEFPINSLNHRFEHPEESDSWTSFRVVKEV